MHIRKTFAFVRRVFFASIILAQIALFQMPAKVALATDQAATTIVISAVQITGGTGHTSEDFVELYNPTDTPLDLNGFRLVKRTAAGTTDTLIKSWTQSTVVSAHHFYLWANSTFIGITAPPDSTTTGTLADNNGVALRQGANDAGVIIDALSWGSTANGFAVANTNNPIGNQSLMRNDLFSAVDSFSIAASQPRNSSVQVLPLSPVVPDPVVVPITPTVPDPTPTSPAVEAPAVVETSPVVEVPTPVGPLPIETFPIPEPVAPDPIITPIVPDATPATTPIIPDSTPVVVPPAPVDPVAPLPAPINLKITELLPNPAGEDSGFEQVELYNAGQESVNLKDFKLDDVLNIDSLSSNAYTLPDFQIDPDSYLAITIPAGKFALNNTGGDVVTLFDSAAKPLTSAFYEESAEEGKSWSYFETAWAWTNPTFGEKNVLIAEIPETSPQPVQAEVLKHSHNNNDLIISEVYPQPTSGEQEFIEIYNSGQETAELSELDLYVGEKHRQLPEQELTAGEYFVITQDNFPVQLRNSGQEIKLQQGASLINSVTYPTAIKGSSYALFEDGFLWTTNVTKDQKNILLLPEEVKKVTAKAAAKTAVKATVKADVKTAAKAPAKPAVPKTTSVAANKNTNTATAAKSSKPSTTQTDSLGKIIAMGAATVTAGVIALYKFIFTTGIK